MVLPLVFPLAYLLWNAAVCGALGGVLPAGRLLELGFNTVRLVVTVVVAGRRSSASATAWLTSRTNLAGRRVWSTLAALPLVIPSYVGALALLGATGREGDGLRVDRASRIWAPSRSREGSGGRRSP